MQIEEKIAAKTARVGIVGLGYVGLPLAVEFAKAGFTVTGIDVLANKVEMLNKGESYVQDVPTSTLAPLVAEKKFSATTDFSVIRELDTINICVPTPLRKTKDPDMSFIVSAAQEIAKYFHPGLLVILESTTYPGTTNELLLPMFEQSGLKVGEDFFLCFSPERVDPGNPVYQTLNTPKVVGGITPACTEVGRLFFACARAAVFQHTFHDEVGAFAMLAYFYLIFFNINSYSFSFIVITLVHFLLHLIYQLGIYFREIIHKI